MNHASTTTTFWRWLTIIFLSFLLDTTINSWCEMPIALLLITASIILMFDSHHRYLAYACIPLILLAFFIGHGLMIVPLGYLIPLLLLSPWFNHFFYIRLIIPAMILSVCLAMQLFMIDQYYYYTPEIKLFNYFLRFIVHLAVGILMAFFLLPRRYQGNPL